MNQPHPGGMFTVSVGYGPTFVLIAATGHATTAEMCGALALGAETARRTGRRCFLFDLLAIDFQGTPEEREEMGRFAATLRSHVDRLAVVLPPQTHTGAGERAAQQEGLNLRNFSNLPEAINWLAS